VKWGRVVPKNHEWTLTLDAAELQRTVKRTAIVAREDANRLQFTVRDTLSIQAISPEGDECHEELDCEKEGDVPQLSFYLNAPYLLDALDALGGDRVTLRGTAPMAPITFRPEGDESSFVVIMPMRARDHELPGC